MGRNSTEWIGLDQYHSIEVGDKLTVRFFINKAEVVEAPTEKEVIVRFIAGPMVVKGEVGLIRQQIKAVNE